MLRQKAIISGDKLEVVTTPYYRNRSAGRKPNQGLSGFVSADSLRRAKSEVKRIVWANDGKWKKKKNGRMSTYPVVFMTLTFADNVQDFSHANHEFTLFIKRMNYHLFKHGFNDKLAYVVVPEFQQRGAIHYHILFFNLPYIEQSKILQIWNNGSVWVEKVEQLRNTTAYITKVFEYMVKNIDDSRLFSKKKYFAGNVFRSMVFVRRIDVNDFYINEIKYSGSFDFGQSGFIGVYILATNQPLPVDFFFA